MFLGRMSSGRPSSSVATEPSSKTERMPAASERAKYKDVVKLSGAKVD